MADLCDQADIQNTVAVEAALKTSRRANGPGANGRCHYCGAGLVPGLRWCDALCREDWEREQAAIARNGK